MAIYVTSDLHGDRVRFHRMLKLIDFSAQDRLYIIGDVIDRGSDGIGLLQDIRAAENITLLLGNHEDMCLRYHAPDATERAIAHWNRNRNVPTLAGLARLSAEEKADLLAYLAALPVSLEVRVGERTFHLVHGFPADTVHDQVWLRPEPGTPNPLPGKTVIIGHTPVVYLERHGEQAHEYLNDLAARGEHLRIYHAPGFIDIDCLCGYDEYPAGCLACLRLDDMREYYC